MPDPGRGRPWTRPRRVLTAKGYSSRAIRERLRRRGITATIPERADQRATRQRRGRTGGRPPAFDPVVPAEVPAHPGLLEQFIIMEFAAGRRPPQRRLGTGQ